MANTNGPGVTAADREQMYRIVSDWLREWDGRGMGNYVPDDPVMQDLIERVATTLAAVRAEEANEWLCCRCNCRVCSGKNAPGAGGMA